MSFDLAADGYVITYADRPISIREIVFWDRAVQYNDVDVLYNKHTLCVRGVINAVIYGDKRAGFRNFDINGMLRDFSKPRQELKLKLGEKEEWFVHNEFTDSRGGPFPKDFRILKVIGKTLLVEFTIEFYSTDLQSHSPFPALLSNRWSMTTSLDENFYQSRTVVGRAVFDQSVLKAGLPNGEGVLESDDFRAYLLLPCPPRWRRFGPNIAVSASGLEIEYSYSDIQQSVNIYPPYVSQIAVYSTYDHVQPAPEAFISAALGLMVTVGTGGMMSAPDLDVGPNAGIRERAAAKGGGKVDPFAVAGNIGNAAMKVAGAMPTHQTTTVIHVRGTPLASMNNLAFVANACLQYRLSLIPPMFQRKKAQKNQVVGPTELMHWGADYASRTVTISCTQTCGPLATLAEKFSASSFFGPLIVSKPGLPIAYDGVGVVADVRKQAPQAPTRGEGDVPRLKAQSFNDGAESPDPALVKDEMGDSVQRDPRGDGTKKFDAKDVGLTS